MKKIVLGLILGMTIGVMGFTYADELEYFTALKADFKVLVNGNELKTDKPIVTINRSTYLPLRVIGETLGVKVNWNNDLRQVEVGETKATFDFKNIVTNLSYGLTEIEGEITNNDNKDYSAIIVRISFYDEEGKLLGSVKGVINNLKSRETKVFTAMGDKDYTKYKTYKIQVDSAF